MPSADPLARARRRPLFEPGPTSEKTRLGTAAIERLLPHRDPMLLVDVIEAVDLPARRLQASRRIDPSDPVPEWAAGDGFLSITRTATELSIVCDEALPPAPAEAPRLSEVTDACESSGQPCCNLKASKKSTIRV